MAKKLSLQVLSKITIVIKLLTSGFLEILVLSHNIQVRKIPSLLPRADAHDQSCYCFNRGYETWSAN